MFGKLLVSIFYFYSSLGSSRLFWMRDNLVNNLFYLSQVLVFSSQVTCVFGSFVTSYGSRGRPCFWLNNFGWYGLKADVYGLLRFFPRFG